jgi:4a-hydroxytetrahydrobiopterin dehydratase
LVSAHLIRQAQVTLESAVLFCFRFIARSRRISASRFSGGAMPSLSEHDIKSRLVHVPDWQIESGELVRTFLFKDFRGSLAFVNKVGEAAENAGHHPDIDIRYNKVRLALVTHDAGGITQKDFDLAAAADKLC